VLSNAIKVVVGINETKIKIVIILEDKLSLLNIFIINGDNDIIINHEKFSVKLVGIFLKF
jgi:hypothetical protein